METATDSGPVSGDGTYTEQPGHELRNIKIYVTGFGVRGQLPNTLIFPSHTTSLSNQSPLCFETYCGWPCAKPNTTTNDVFSRFAV